MYSSSELEHIHTIRNFVISEFKNPYAYGIRAWINSVPPQDMDKTKALCKKLLGENYTSLEYRSHEMMDILNKVLHEI